MQINPVHYGSNIITKTQNVGMKHLKNSESEAVEQFLTNSTGNRAVISFRGGNADHVLHVVAECKPFHQKGGVATVVEDYKKLNNASPTEKGMSVIVTPYYNGLVQYDDKGIRKGVDIPRVPKNLPEGHVLKGHEGEPIFVKTDLSMNTLDSALKPGKDFFLLEEVSSKTMTWGLEKNAPIKLLKVVSDKNGNKLKDDIFMVFTEATAYDPEPYSQGQYSSANVKIENSWLGDPYAKFDKAVVEVMEDIPKKVSGFDPGTVVCSDSQAAYVTHHMAKKNAQGLEFFKGKKPVQIGHNLGDGYIGITSSRNMLINLDLYTPEELKVLMNTPEYIEALQGGAEHENKLLAQYFAKMKSTNKISAMSVATHYGQTGYLQKFGVVSQGYLDEIVKNPEIAPYLHDDMEKLKKAGVAVGLTNPLNDGHSAFKKANLPGYSDNIKLKLADGTEEIIKPLAYFEEAERDTINLAKLKEQKIANKINFLERFLPKYDGAKYFDTKSNTWIESGDEFIRTGLGGKKAPLVQTIDIAKYVQKLKNGEDVNVIVSWGRGDFQKAFDEVLTGFKKYIQKTKDPNALLILGGDLSIDKAEGDKIKSIADVLSKDSIFKDRIMVIDGFAPGRPMARMADAAIFPSRTAPCELTDFEAKSELCTPIVSNGQGLKQKNFDPAIAKEFEMADAYKTAHQYFDSREEMLKSAKPEDKQSFEKVFNKVKEEIETRYKIKFGSDIPAEKLEKELTSHEEYNLALRKLRDSVMSDELADAMERCLITNKDNDIAAKILHNQAHLQTDWEHNQKVTQSEKPTGQLYRDIFHLDHKNVKAEDVIGHGIDKPQGSYSQVFGGSKEKSFINNFKDFFRSKTGKWTTAGVCAVAIAGICYKVMHKPNKKDLTDTEIKSKHMSAVV